jgi:hypothetical protein
VKQTKHKLSAAGYSLRSVKPFMSQGTVKMVYYAYYSHSIINCRLIFWWSSSDHPNIFKIQYIYIYIYVIRIVTGWKSRDLFKNPKFLCLQAQHILSLLLFVVNNKNKFKLNSDVYKINTSQKYNFHQPSSNLSIYQKHV